MSQPVDVSRCSCACDRPVRGSGPAYRSHHAGGWKTVARWATRRAMK